MVIEGTYSILQRQWREYRNCFRDGILLLFQEELDLLTLFEIISDFLSLLSFHSFIKTLTKTSYYMVYGHVFFVRHSIDFKE